MSGAAITELLNQASAGNRLAEEELLAEVYRELRRIARKQSRGRDSAATAPATALLHEVYCSLVSSGPVPWPSRRHFLAAYTRAVHNRLVDRIRRRAARGQFVTRPENLIDDRTPFQGEDVVALREHLEQLERLQPRAAEVLRIHYLAGYTIPEIATTLSVGHATVERDLHLARSWLHHRMRPP